MNVKTLRVPIANPRPDARTFIETVMGTRAPGRVPMVEYIIDDAVMRPIVSELMGRTWVDYTDGREQYLLNFIDFWYRMGYDAVRYEVSLPFAESKLAAKDTGRSLKDREWANEHVGSIMSWEDFERYPWPKIEAFDFSDFEFIDSHLPDGMGLITCHGGGVFEHLSWIMSLEGLCTALMETPDLVKATADRLGELMVGFYAHLLDLRHVVAVFPGDDLGFRTSTLISPKDLRKYVLPWHRRFAEMAHSRGLPYFLHSCGNIMSILGDLIDDVRIDGKHSFEDAIIPAPDFQERVAGRIAVLGGVDLNVLSGKTPEEVRRRTRSLIEACGPRGRFAIGSGNSVPSYVPVENYLAMAD